MCIATAIKQFPEPPLTAEQLRKKKQEQERRREANITSDGSLLGDYVR